VRDGLAGVVERRGIEIDADHRSAAVLENGKAVAASAGHVEYPP
jgi:hypothetical protein